jgi:hypothetical protein
MPFTRANPVVHDYLAVKRIGRLSVCYRQPAIYFRLHVFAHDSLCRPRQEEHAIHGKRMIVARSNLYGLRLYP